MEVVDITKSFAYTEWRIQKSGSLCGCGQTGINVRQADQGYISEERFSAYK